MELFGQQVLNGLALGSIYAMMAIGFAIVYGILLFVNMPHGEVMMLSMYVFLTLRSWGLPLVLALGLTVVLTAALGVLIEKVAYRRLRYQRRLAPVLSAYGLVVVFQNAAMLVWSATILPFPLAAPDTAIQIGAFRISPTTLIILAVALLLMALLQLFFNRTVLGMAVRAASQDRQACQYMGVNIDHVVSVAFAIGSSLAAISGFLVGMRYHTLYPTIGFGMMIKAMTACILGGIGSIAGAVVGAFILAMAEVMTVTYISSWWRDTVAFVIMVLVLLVRPTGLFGGRGDVTT